MEALLTRPELTAEIERREDGALVLHLAGRLDSDTTGEAWRRSIPWLERAAPRLLVIDASGVNYCDGTGAALLLHMRAIQQRQRRRVTLQCSPEVRDLLAIYQQPTPEPIEAEAPRNLVADIGGVTRGWVSSVFDQLALVGESVIALVWVARRPSRLRWREVVQIMQSVGVDAIPIVALLGLLIGLILAFQSAIPLRRFGADLFVANMVGLSVIREIGPLMTAIILAGRSGSAFAAELGTMKVKEEVDALVTMGLNPVRFLVVPRIVAAVAMTPLMTLVMEAFALVGGCLVMMSLGYAPATFVSQVQQAVHLPDFIGGLLKSIAFGLLVAGIGCARGLQTGSGASAVGVSTTRAVVSGLVLIVVVDGIFAIFFYYVRL